MQPSMLSRHATNQLRGHELLGGPVPRGRRRVVEHAHRPRRVPRRHAVRRLPGPPRHLPQHPQRAPRVTSSSRGVLERVPYQEHPPRATSTGSPTRAAISGRCSPRCGSGATAGRRRTARRSRSCTARAATSPDGHRVLGVRRARDRRRHEGRPRPRRRRDHARARRAATDRRSRARDDWVRAARDSRDTVDAQVIASNGVEADRHGRQRARPRIPARDTCSAKSRREMLGILGAFGLTAIGAGVLAVCGSDTKSNASSSSSAASARDHDDVGGGGDHHDRRRGGHDDRQDPRGDGGPVPGRRHERSERADPERHRAQRHPVELRFVVRHGARACRSRSSSRSSTSSNGCGRSPAPPSTSGTATSTATTRCTRRASQTENYLRGVQAADANGDGDLHEHLPGRYSGRWPHIHFEVYPTLATATQRREQDRDVAARAARRRLQRGLRDDGYSQSVQNLAQTSLTTDMVFSDGVSLQTPTMSGNTTSGYTAKLLVGV